MKERYDSYKDSGIEWIGKIPSGWIVSKLKFDSSTPVQYGINISGDKYVEEGIRFIRITDITESGYLNPNDGKYLDSEDVPNEFLLRKYDVLFCRSGHTVGKTYLHTKEGLFTSGGYLVRFNFRNLIESKFIFYLSKTDFYWDWIKLNTVVSTIENVNGDKYQNFVYPKPPLSEQQHIVSYLDTKTSLIDSLIEKTYRKIELLKENRTSLINEVVTKGLNPNVEMRDSGVEWIGEIPSGWGFVKLKQLFKIEKRISGELGYDVLSVTQRGLKVKDLENNEGQHSMDYSKYQMVFRDDFVMNHMDLLTGYVDLSKQTGVTSPDYRVFTKVKNDTNDEYYLYIFQLCYLRRIFYGLGRGVSNLGRWRLPSIEFLDFYIPYPPLSEQQQIVSYLDEHTQLIDKTVSVEERRIDTLKEYRQSLISEVVTGKRKVLESENLLNQIMN